MFFNVGLNENTDIWELLIVGDDKIQMGVLVQTNVWQFFCVLPQVKRNTCKGSLILYGDFGGKLFKPVSVFLMTRDNDFKVKFLDDLVIVMLMLSHLTINCIVLYYFFVNFLKYVKNTGYNALQDEKLMLVCFKL